MTPVHLSRDHPHQIRARSTLRWITVVRGQSRYKCQSRHKQDTESHHCNCDGIISGNLKRRETPKVANRAVWCSKWPKAECSPLQGKKATSRWSDHAAAEATSLASPILNSRKGISIYRRGATLLARKMQPDHLKELAERLYDLRDTARIIPLAQVEIGDGSASGDWSPFPRFPHDNVNIWVRRSPEYKAVRGWVVFDFSSILRFELDSFGSPHTPLSRHPMARYGILPSGTHRDRTRLSAIPAPTRTSTTLGPARSCTSTTIFRDQFIFRTKGWVCAASLLSRLPHLR